MRKLTLLALTLIAALPQLAQALPEPHEPAAEPAQLKWRMPLDSGRVSSFFGALRGRHTHEGIDFSVPSGTLVTATDGGTVVASDTHYGGDRKYGNVVVIEHASGLRSLYAHLNQRDVSVGDVVSIGERIGLSGNTGRSTGPHLHLEAWRDKTRIDPRALLLANLNDSALPSAMRSARSKAKESAHPGTKAKKLVAARSSSRKKATTAGKTTKARKRA
jgi:murein DD-endopeptidase MepM/ murein hydrolase activator NlpD